MQSLLKSAPTEISKSADEIQKKLQLEYLQEEVPSALAQSIEGLGRVGSIVRAMREFSYPGEGKKMLVDLKSAIESTLTISHSAWRNVAEIETDYDPNLSQVMCLRDELNQVILNLLINAAHAISDVVGGGKEGMGKIKIQTINKGSWAEIKISDTGSGIPKEIQHRIFEPFFTTKEVGKGTVQGLAIAYSMIVDKHKGQLIFDSEVGKGTTFTIKLPLQQN
jgi:signal transduction histidine kinase